MKRIDRERFHRLFQELRDPDHPWHDASYILYAGKDRAVVEEVSDWLAEFGTVQYGLLSAYAGTFFVMRDANIATLLRLRFG